jgi:hypothetical protein
VAAAAGVRGIVQAEVESPVEVPPAAVEVVAKAVLSEAAATTAVVQQAEDQSVEDVATDRLEMLEELAEVHPNQLGPEAGLSAEPIQLVPLPAPLRVLQKQDCREERNWQACSS